MRRQKNLELRELIPRLARKYRTLSRTKLVERILADCNVQFTPQAVTMFFKRHPQIETELRTEIVEEDKEQIVVNESMFENGTFEELPSVKKWIIEMTGHLGNETIYKHLRNLRSVCMGTYCIRTQNPNGIGIRTRQFINGWAFKHPDRLTIEHVKEYIARLGSLGRTTNNIRIALRSFFLSRDNVTVKSRDISGEKNATGKYNNVYVEKSILERIFEYVSRLNYEASIIDRFMYKTATRINASLDVKKKDFWKDGCVNIVRVVDKGLHRKGRQTWDKLVPLSLMEEIEKISQDRDDRVFSLKEYELCKINKEAYTVFLKDDPRALELALKEPNHFWRHMFAQHMLRATNWNYVLVAKLGGWKDRETLIESYGMPPSEMIRKEGLSTIPEI